MNKKSIHTIATHSGSFHADDVLAMAILLLLYPTAKIFRTRDPEIFNNCDVAADVGGEYNPTRGRFDHHQKGFSEKRNNGIPYAGAGLVWKTFGSACVACIADGLSPDEHQKIADEVDARLIQHVDAVDNGIEVPGPHDFGLSMLVDRFNLTWMDNPDAVEKRFFKAIEVCGHFLINLVHTIHAEIKARDLVLAAPTLSNGKVLILDKASLPFNETICAEMPDVEFVVYPESTGGQWQVRVVPIALGSFTARRDLPEAWAGLRDTNLAKITGVSDAVFCHNGRFICGAKTKNSAIAMALMAV